MQPVYFIEQDFDEVDQVLAIKEPKETRLEQITAEELLYSQHDDAFYPEISLHLILCEKLSFSQNGNGLRDLKIHSDRHIASLIP